MANYDKSIVACLYAISSIKLYVIKPLRDIPNCNSRNETENLEGDIRNGTESHKERVGRRAH